MTDQDFGNRTALKVSGLNAWYGESHVLHGMAFHVGEGEVVTLLGRNGAGKTTTLKAIMGLMEKREGSIAFEGTETIGLTADRIGRLGIGYCPEERGIFSSLNVEENLMLPPVVRKGGLTVEEIYELFPNLLERLHSQGTKLSGGEQQMLAIARILTTGAQTGRLSWEHTDFDQSYNGGPFTETESESLKTRLSLGIDGTVAEAANVVSLLLEEEEDSSTSNPLYGRENTSLALEYRGRFLNGLDVQLGARYDDNSVFGDSTTWTTAASYTLDNGVRLHASAGTGVVNPTYFELYANVFGYSGNPNLDPERNRSVDVGVEFPFANGRGLVDVTYFNETLTDEITAVSTGPGTFTYINQTGDSDWQGLEVFGRFAATETLDLRLSYTYLEASNPNGTVEVRRPRHALGLGATLRTFGGRGKVSADARYVAGNFDSQFFGTYATAELPDYWKVDVAATYALTPNLTASARIENLFDEDYSDTWGYASRGRTVYVGLRSEF